MEWTTSQVVRSYALNVCEMCKKRKRKCDKRLPKCSFCARYMKSFIIASTGNRLILRSSKNRTCKYTDFVDSHPSEISWNVTQPDALPQKSQFPGVYFLDHEVFQQSLVEIPNPSIPLSRQILKLLGDDSQIRNVASQFFDNTHPFMPFISKKLFYERHINPLARPRTDISLLCLCMKIFSEFNNDPQTQVYVLAKHYIVEIEVAGTFTLQTLQAHLLIAIYELGHGIYPSAYLSIVACAARGIALDLEKELTDCTTSEFTWVEREERRRVWWAIIILERFENTK